MDTLLSMQVFRRVVDAGSFAGAATATGLSRSMVSKHVTYLEDRLGVRLLHRTTRSLHLTDEGAAYLERCGPLLDDFADIEAAMKSARTRVSGSLRISVPDAFGLEHLTPVVATFLNEHPDAAIDISLGNRPVDLVEEGFDLAIRIGALPESTLIARRLCTARLVVLASPAYLDRHGMPRAPADLAKHACISYTAVSQWSRRWRFGRGGQAFDVEIRPRLLADSGAMQTQAAVAGLGIALVPTFVAGDDLLAGRVRAVLTEYELPELGVFAVYPSRKHLSAKVRAFVDLLGAAFNDPPPWDRWMLKSSAPASVKSSRLAR